MRKLSCKEIDYILKDIEELFPKCALKELQKSYTKDIIDNLQKMLKKEEVYDDFKDIDKIKIEIEKHVSRSIIQPGEGVGVICAQSIGERQTQLSVGYEEEVLFYDNDNLKIGKIGYLLDQYFKIFKNNIKTSLHNSEILFIPNLKIPMVTKKGFVRLVDILEISRHPPNGNLIKITTETNRSIITTLSHSHLQRIHNQILPIKAIDLKIGNKIPILRQKTWLFQLKYNDIKISKNGQIICKNDQDVNDIALFLNTFGLITNIQSKNVVDIKCNLNKTDCMGDIYWDKIIKIEYITDYKYKHVYDFSVKGNQTFMMRNGIFVHNTLNSFHQSGLSVATVVTGVPRFLELLNATKEPKMSTNTFYLYDSIKNVNEVRNIINSTLIYNRLTDLVVSEKIFLEKEEEFWFAAYEIIYSNQFREYTSGITFFLNIDKLFKHKITLTDIKDKIESNYADVCCVISPIYIGQIDVFINTTEIKIPNIDTVPFFLKEKNYIEIYLESIVKPKLLEIDICGIKNIKNYHYLLEDGHWKIQTEGSNIIDILHLPYIDISTISSNNMWEIYNVMGIEATREFLIEEFTNVVSSDGTFINPSHILLLVDIMTYQGNITSVSRYGMKKEQMGVLSRASFEESLDQFCNAGFYSEKDQIRSVSANIMCGKRSSIGSGLCSLIMDWKTILNKS